MTAPTESQRAENRARIRAVLSHWPGSAEFTGDESQLVMLVEACGISAASVASFLLDVDWVPSGAAVNVDPTKALTAYLVVLELYATMESVAMQMGVPEGARAELRALVLAGLNDKMRRRARKGN